MKLSKKQRSLAFAILIGSLGLTACNQNNNPEPSSSSLEDLEPISNQVSDESMESPSVEEEAYLPEKEYDQMTKDEKISYLEDKIFNIRVKARSLEMKLEENPQYSEADKEKIQKSLDDTDELIDRLNEEIDKLENK